MIVHRSSSWVVFISPDLIQQFIAGENFPGIFGQVLQQPKFLTCEGYGFRAAFDLHGTEGDAYVREGVIHWFPALRCWLVLCRKDASHGATNPRNQFLRTKRFGYI